MLGAGHDRGSHEESLLGDRVARDEFGTVVLGGVDVPFDPFLLPPTDHRPKGRGRVEAAPNDVLRCDRRNPVHDVIVGALLHIQPGTGHADLSGVQENRLRCTGRRRLAVGVGEDDRGRLAAQLQGHGLGVGRGRTADGDPRRGRALEENLADQWVLSERLTGFGSGPGDDVHYPRWETCLEDQLAQKQRRERRVLGRLQDDGASGGKGGRHLPDRQHERHVPRNNASDDTDGFPSGVAHRPVAAGTLKHQRPSGDFRGPSRHVAHDVGGSSNVEIARQGQRHPVVERLENGKGLDVLIDEACEPVE